MDVIILNSSDHPYVSPAVEFYAFGTLLDAASSCSKMNKYMGSWEVDYTDVRIHVNDSILFGEGRC